MSLSRPTLTALVNRVTLDVEAATGYSTPLLPVSVLRVLSKVFAGAIHMLYGYVQWMSRQIFPDTAESIFLDRWAAVWGVTRQAATFAGCSLTVTGQNGSSIPEGTLWIAESGQQYASTALASIAGGTAAVAVEAVASGSAANVSSGDAVSLVSPVAGVDSSATVAASGITDGQDTEEDSALLTRLLARIQNPPQGGALTDYVSWAREIAGVTRAWAYSNWLGVGTVGVTFVMDNAEDGPIPDAGTIAEVQAYIDSVCPVTADVTVFAPVSKVVDFTIHLVGSTAELQAAVTAALTAYINEQGYPGQTLLYTAMIQVIAESAGGHDFVLSVPAANISIANTEFAVMGEITWA